MSAPVTTAHPQARPTGSVIVAQHVSELKGATTEPPLSRTAGFAINLMPTFGAALPSAQATSGSWRLLRLAVITVWLVTLLYAAMVGYQGWYLYRNQTSQQQLQILTEQIDEYDELLVAVTKTNSALTMLQKVVAQHLYWSNWFAFLEEYTLPTIYYTDFSGHSGGNMTLTAMTNDYAMVSQQIRAFRAATDWVDAVQVNTVTQTEDLITFTMLIKVKPDLLYYHPDYARD